jgi:cytoskeletal protein CcmA (bactofilin family)
MPLRPSLLSFHPQGPRPPRRRAVHCPRCRHGFTLSRRAVTVRCPRCATPIAFDDLSLGQSVEGTITTMGRVTLRDTGRVRGRLTCGSLDQAGRFEGEATVYGHADLAAGSRTTGTLIARSVAVREHATFVGRLRITADPGPPPTPRPRARTLDTVQPVRPDAVHGLPTLVPKW